MGAASSLGWPTLQEAYNEMADPAPTRYTHTPTTEVNSAALNKFLMVFATFLASFDPSVVVPYGSCAMSLPDGLLQRRRSSVRNSPFERQPSVAMERRNSDTIDGGPMERRHSQKTRKGPVPQALMMWGVGQH